MRLPPRRALIIFGIVLGTLGVLTALGYWVAYPRVGRWMVREKVIPKLEKKLGRQVTVGDIDVGHGHATLHDVVVRGERDGDQPLVTIDKVEVDFDFWASLAAKPELGNVVVTGVHVRARRDADGQDNFRDVVARLRGEDQSGGTGGSSLGSLRPPHLDVDSGDLEYQDDLAGVSVKVGHFDGDWTRNGPAIVHCDGVQAATSFGPEASADMLIATDDPVAGRQLEVQGGEVSVWKGLSLTGIEGAIAPDSDHRFSIRFAGGYGGVAGQLWTASGVIDPHGAASIDLDAERFTLDKLRAIVEKSPVLDYDKASVDAKFHIDLSAAQAAFSGEFHLRDFTVSHPMLAEKPVAGLEVGGDIAGRFDRATRTLVLDHAKLLSRGLPFELSGWAALPGGLLPDGTRRPRAALDMRVAIPPMPCQDALDAIPPELDPYLQGFVLSGTFDTDLRVAIDWAHLDDDHVVLAGHVGIWGCHTKKAPDEVARLKDSFEDYVEVERGQWLTFVIGPENPDFVPLTDVSPYLLDSLQTTEDSNFYHHRGFITHEFKSALVKDLQAGGFKFGASSITMQMVKNVLLYAEKTASRKFQELFLTWYVETALSKDRILEIYVNAIEYGPGIYGIGPAAMHYFGKPAKDLNPVEAAFFSSILPNPKERYAQYCKGTLRKWTEDKIQRILGLMLKRGRLTQEEYDQAVVTPLQFVKDGSETEEECMQRRAEAIKNARPTNPLKK